VGVKLITLKIFMRIKLGANGDIERFRIRIVARGFTH
jgi:hypothetical protein